MKSIKGGTGVVFDIQAKDAEAFIDNFTHLKATIDARRVDFDIQRCKSLPDLE